MATDDTKKTNKNSTVSPINTKRKYSMDPKDKKKIILWSSIGSGVLIVLIVLIFLFKSGVIGGNSGNESNVDPNSDEAKAQVQALKDSYSDAGVELDDSDIKVTEDANGNISVEVINQEKIDGVHKSSESVLNAINNDRTGNTNGSYEYNWSDPSSGTDDGNNSNGQNKVEAEQNGAAVEEDVEIPEQQETIDIKYIEDMINSQKKLVANWIARSTSTNNLYGAAAQSVLVAMREGHQDAIYDNHSGMTFTDVYPHFLFRCYTDMATDGATKDTWNNSSLYNADSDTNCLYNFILKGAYNDGDYKITLINEDDSKSYYLNNEDATLNSVYSVTTNNGRKIYLDYSFNIIDIA